MTPRRIDPPAAADATEFQCPKCGAAMVRRVAKRGENAGSEFWGCSMFPKCRTIAPIKDPEQEEAPVADGTDLVCPFSSPPPDPPDGLLKKAIAAMDGIWRWNLGLDEPDAKDRWKPAHRRKVLNYLHIRDGERCGLCGGTMKLKGAQVEHVVPKRFAVFELSAEGEARQGTYYTSVLHEMENLQAAHPRCNKYKGNTPDIRRWRHPSMPGLVVARTEDDRVLMLPPQDDA